ncbi:MAG: ABC transporter permease [Candidatus Acidiferrales bacterium]
MGALWQDLKYGMRMLAKNPSFTTVAILTLALGIGANATIFSFVDAFFYRPLPAKDPYQLVAVGASRNGEPAWGFAYPEYAYFRDHSKTLKTLAAHYSTSPLNITANGDSREEEAAVVSANYFELLGMRPCAGRFFLPEEDSVPDRDAVAVLAYAYWQNRFGGNLGIIGKQIGVNGLPFTIVGIAPKDFHGVQQGADDALFIPTMMLHVGYRWTNCFHTGCHALSLLGRLTAGKNPDQARAELAGLYEQLQSSYLPAETRRGILLAPALGAVEFGDRADYTDQMRLLMAVAGLLLLIACANLAGILLAKGAARQKEMAVRLALGASRIRLVRQLLAENLLLALPGGASGLLASVWAKEWLAGYYTAGGEGHLGFIYLSLDVLVIVFSIAISVATGVIFGLVPAVAASRQELNSALKESGAARGRRSGLPGMLVVGQVALSLGLLVSAGLLMQSASRIRAGANFDPRHVALMRLRPRLVNYSPEKAQVFVKEVVRRLEALPGVESVSLSRGQGGVWELADAAPVRLPGQTFARPEDVPQIDFQEVAPRLFETLRIPLIQGRDFNDGDHPGSPRVAIVNETLARRFWGNDSPLERILIFNDRPYQVIGVAKDAQFRSALDPPTPFVYLPFWQNDIAPQVDARFCVRVSGDAAGMIPLLHREVQAADPVVPIAEEMPLTAQVEGHYESVLLTRSVLVVSSMLALFLSAIGLYGVLAFAVSQRTREIGIRIALGAQARDVLRMILGQGLRLTTAGTALGLAGGLALSHALAHFLYGVSSSDPLTFAGVALLITAVAILSSFIPARRATKVDPMVALRYE